MEQVIMCSINPFFLKPEIFYAIQELVLFQITEHVHSLFVVFTPMKILMALEQVVPVVPQGMFSLMTLKLPLP